MNMWFKKDNSLLIIHLYAKPKAKKSMIVGIIGQELHVAIKAKPLDGEANKELLNFLALFFKLPKSQIMLLHGANSRHKIVQMPINNVVEDFIANPIHYIS